jgi:hypothetical protein
VSGWAQSYLGDFSFGDEDIRMETDPEKPNEKLPETQAEKKPDGRGKSPGSRKRQFGPGGKLPNHDHGASRPKEDELEPAEGDFDLLAAMRHVLSKRASLDNTILQKECRAWLKAKKSVFMARLADLVKAEMTARAPGRTGRDDSDDHNGGGTAWIEQWLEKSKEKQRGQDLEFSKRPDAAQIGVTLQRRLDEALRRERVLLERVAELEQTASRSS